MKKVVFRVIELLSLVAGGYFWLFVTTLLAVVNNLYANKYFLDPNGHMEFYDKASNFVINNYQYVLYFSGACVIALFILGETNLIHKIVGIVIILAFVFLSGNLIPIVRNIVESRMQSVSQDPHIIMFATLIGVDIVFVLQEVVKNIIGVMRLQPMKQETYALAVATTVDDIIQQYLDKDVDFDADLCDSLIKKYGGYDKNEFTE